MIKISPTKRLIHLVQYIRLQNSKGIQPNKNSIIRHMRSYSDDNYTNQQFDRDKRKIREIFEIELIYLNKEGYFIEYSDEDYLKHSSLDHYLMYAVLYEANDFPEIFMVSERKPKGLHLINETVLFIKNKELIQFKYLKYDTNENQIRKIEPLAIKESRERWYLLGNDYPKNNGLRAFAFDRIEDILPIGEKFSPKYTLADIQNKYNPLFAMFDAEEQDVEEIVLQFDQRDGNYIKSFPIHHSQKVSEINNGVEVHLKLKTTPDFIMEIMSRAWSLKVIKPESLRLEIIQILKESIERNQ